MVGAAHSGPERPTPGTPGGAPGPASDGIDLEGARARLRAPRDRAEVFDVVDALARRAADGDRAALGLVLGAVLDHRLAERAVRSVLLDDADVDDAVQGALIAVAENIGGFEGRARFTTWLDRVARNEALTLLRRRNRKSEPEPADLPDAAAPTPRLSSLVADEQTMAELMARLPDDYRTALLLREEAGCSYDEIAARTGVPVGTVRSRLSRARRALAELLVDARLEGGTD